MTGQILITINAQAQTVEQKKEENSSIKPYIESTDIYVEILKIKEELIKLRNDALNNNYVN